MNDSFRRFCNLIAATMLFAAVLGSAKATDTTENTSGLLIPPDILSVVTQWGEEHTLRAIVQHQEIYAFLIIEAFEPGGEGTPPRLLWRSEFSRFNAPASFNPDVIEEMSWHGDELRFLIIWYEGKKTNKRKCRLKTAPGAMPVCGPRLD